MRSMQPGFPYAQVPYPPVDDRAPGVVLWARLYAAAFALMYLACTVGGILLLVFAGDLADRDRTETMINGVVMIAMGPPLLGLSIVTALAPRKRWGWIINVVLIGLGMMSCCCVPASVPLLIFWIKPETKRWYGMWP
jgi:hypothetical protein